MGKDPAFLFYPNDWLGGTMGMTFEEKGAYMELLMLQFNRGHMTTHMIGRTVGQLWDNIQDKFIKDGKGLYFNQRLEDEQTKRKAFTQSRRNNIKGTNQYSKKSSGHMTEHMEDENRDEDKDVNRKQKPTIKERTEIVAYLNNRLGTRYSHNSQATANPIIARLNDGYTVEDFKIVIDKKANEWESDEKYAKFLRPSTLFSPKFEGYLNQVEATISQDELLDVELLKHAKNVRSQSNNSNPSIFSRVSTVPQIGTGKTTD